MRVANSGPHYLINFRTLRLKAQSLALACSSISRILCPMALLLAQKGRGSRIGSC